MNSAIQEIAVVSLATGTISLVVAWLLLRLSPTDFAQRQALPIGLAIAWMAGCLFIEPRARQPCTHWTWLPWMAAIAALLAPIGLASGVRLVERWLLNAVLALAAAWFLVPTWTHLQPARSVHVAVIATGTFLLAAILDPISRRNSPAWLPFSMLLAAACGAGLLADAVSLRFAQLGGVAASGLGGAWVVSLLHRSGNIVRGLLLPYAVMVGGLMLAGSLESSETPRTSFILVPLAPLAVALFSIAPLSRLRGASGIVGRMVAIGLPLAAAILMAVLSQHG